MAKKTRLDWFKLDCQIDDKFRLIESEYGLKGFGAIIKVFMKIYGYEGYFCHWNKDVVLLFAKDNNISVDIAARIVSCAIRRDIFDKQKYDEFGILTSSGIQQRYFECADRRKNVKINPDYLLISTKSADLKDENDDISRKNDDISNSNVCISSTEESRVEKKRLDEMRVEEILSSSPLTQKQYNSLANEFGTSVVDEYLEKVANYCVKKRRGKPYKNTFQVITKWITQDQPMSLADNHQSFDLDEINDFQKNFLINRKD